MTLTGFDPGPAVPHAGVTPTPFAGTFESLGSSHVQAASISTTSSDSESPLTSNPSDSGSTSTRESTVSVTSSAGGTSAPTTRHSQASSTKAFANATTSSSPSGGPQHTSTIIGAVLGPIVFFLLLSLGAFLLRRWRKTQSSAKLSPNPVLMRRSSSSQSANHSGKSRRRLTGPSVPLDENSVEHSESVSGGGVVHEGDQITPEEDIPHAGTSPSPRAMNDEAVAEILRLSTQIQQLLTERASVWHPDREPDPPPAYVEEGTEDVSR
ncbi:hypothetical protein ARMSODRAFT_981060 [Armillaria solidipes]|uniref:Uncharacterized protein n=1 Tax=Armillaria solidipes TaxID=1076256 RepID=A0A2H3ATK7_9AGAR|nr:hypothetical protein ARMSODRAFT_981060 [Armillaria solidipes]